MLIFRPANFGRPLSSIIGNLKYFSGASETNNDLIVNDFGDKGVITLNRPRHLNVVTLEMITKLLSTLSRWQSNKNLIVIKGAGSKAFCAGGDLRFEGGKNDLHTYFQTFHKTILTIYSCTVPSVALMDGIVMGGGAGLSVFTSFRVASEKTIFAMPETKLAFFPNVGSPYFLQQLNGKLGLYLGLTSNSLKGSDVVKTGIATHYCKSCDIPELEKALLETSSCADIRRVLECFSDKNLPKLSFSTIRDTIDHCFAAPTIEEIITRLEEDGSRWATETLTTLRQFSPTSLKVTLKTFELAKTMTLKESLNMEYRVNMNLIHRSRDTVRAIYAFREGINEQPEWEPPTLADVSDEHVETYFAKFPGEEPL
nr:3-hydroxyisobutyryl-CoA hydrolase, mitochondrial-like [Leptinotarsa decemlineata]